MKHRWMGWLVLAWMVGSLAYAQPPVRRTPRAAPPKFQADEFSGIFFPDPVSQLQGSPGIKPEIASNEAIASSSAMELGSSAGADVWKGLIRGGTIEDLVKESKTRLDSVITTPAKFAGGGYAECRREFTLLASLMAIISQYPEEIRWKGSAPYARTIFARLAANCKVGTQPVYNEAKQRQRDLQELLKGSKLNGASEDLLWGDIADRGPMMQVLEWSLRENMAPAVSNEDNFRENQEDLAKYAELVGAFGHILQQEGMTDADDENYTEMAKAMVGATKDLLQAVKANDAELARTAASRIDQSCNKCHETYR
jgi:hypothetical protein